MEIKVSRKKSEITSGDLVYSKDISCYCVVAERGDNWLLVSLPHFYVVCDEYVYLDNLIHDKELELVCPNKDLILTTK